MRPEIWKLLDKPVMAGILLGLSVRPLLLLGLCLLLVFAPLPWAAKLFIAIVAVAKYGWGVFKFLRGPHMMHPLVSTGLSRAMSHISSPPVTLAHTIGQGIEAEGHVDLNLVGFFEKQPMKIRATSVKLVPVELCGVADNPATLLLEGKCLVCDDGDEIAVLMFGPFILMFGRTAGEGITVASYGTIVIGAAHELPSPEPVVAMTEASDE